ncbi:MAG TPA: TIM barrel protein [Acidimicrobiia bacterium]|nr:TIM barrel protein [Acidimicrobiia bacterium]
MLVSISIQLMWESLPFADRVRAAADAGFDLVDLWDWRNSDIDAVHAVCSETGIGINGFFGTRDTALCDPEAQSEVLEEFKTNLEVAVEKGARHLHVFSNAIRPGGVVVPAPPLSHNALMGACLEALDKAADLAKGTGVQIVLEHLNNVFLPGYLWDDVNKTAALVRELGRDEVGMVFDTFHQQLNYGRLTDSLVGCLDQLVRVDLAQVPGRFEPGVGEIDMGFLLGVLKDAGWDGTLTFEVVPSDGNPDNAVGAIHRLLDEYRWW